MAGQQQQIIDTIFSMKRKILRGNDCMYKSAPCAACVLTDNCSRPRRDRLAVCRLQARPQAQIPVCARQRSRFLVRSSSLQEGPFSTFALPRHRLTMITTAY